MINIKDLKINEDIDLPVFKSNRKLINHEVRPTLPFQDLIQKYEFYIAGGAAASTIWNIEYGDIDLFMVNVSDPVNVIDSFINELPNVISVGRNSCCATIKLENLIIQIIFYNYSSCLEILENFDIGSCSFVITPFGDIFTDKKGAFAYTHKINKLDINMRQSSLEHRLVKYFNRGFSIQIDEIKPINGLTTYKHFAVYSENDKFVEFIDKHYTYHGYSSNITCTCLFTSIENLYSINLSPINFKTNFSDFYRKEAEHTIVNYFKVNEYPRPFNDSINKYIDYYSFPGNMLEQITFRQFAKTFGFNKCIKIVNAMFPSVGKVIHSFECKFSIGRYEEYELTEECDNDFNLLSSELQCIVLSSVRKELDRLKYADIYAIKNDEFTKMLDIWKNINAIDLIKRVKAAVDLIKN